MQDVIKTKEEVEKFTLEKISFLKENGYKKTKVKKDNLSTTIYFKNNFFAIEIALDWRDFEVDGYLVKLENSKIPDGHIVNDGKKVREYIITFLKDMKRNGLDIKLPSVYFPKPKGKKGRAEEHFHSSTLITQIEILADTIETNIEILKENQKIAFEEP